MKRITALILALSLTAGMAGCGSKSESDAGAFKSKAAKAAAESNNDSSKAVLGKTDASEASSQGAAADSSSQLLEDKFAGFYREDVENATNDEEYISELICVGGELIKRSYTWADDEAYQFKIEEFLPDEGAFDKDSVSVTCSHIEYDGAAGYEEPYSEADKEVIELTGDGINITPVDGEGQIEKSYVKIDDPGHFYSITTEEKTKFAKRYPIAENFGIEGNWALEGEVEGTLMSFAEDGSFLYADKVKASSPLVLTGVWGMDSSGNLRIMVEQYASGLSPMEYEATWKIDESGNLAINPKAKGVMSEAYNNWLPADTDMLLTKAEADWSFPDYLFENDDVPVEVYYSEAGTYTDGNDLTYEYSYIVPRITEDTEGAERINGEIAGKYEYYAKADMDAMAAGGSIEYENIDWLEYKYKNILSIVPYANSVYEVNEYSAYSYNLDTGEYINKEAVLSAMGVDKETAVEATRIAAKEEFLRRFGDVDDDVKDSYVYKETLAKTESDECVDNSAKLIVNDTGDLMAIVRIATFAGAGYDYVTLSLDLEKGEQAAKAKEKAKAQAAARPEDSAPSDEAAMETLAADEDMQAMGMSNDLTMMAPGQTETFEGEKCTVVNLGTNHDDNFVTEYTYAVSSTGAIYEYKAVDDKWTALNVLAMMYDDWGKDILFAVYTNPDYASFWYCFDDPDWQNKVRVMPMQSGVNIRVEQIKYNEKTEQYDLVKVIDKRDKCVRADAFTPDFELTETIPSYRIVAEYKGLKGEWYATYDGKDGDGVNLIKGEK